MPSAEASTLSAESPSLTKLFSRLPLEVLGLIVEQAARLHPRTFKETASLCLVSRDFLLRVQRELYHSATICYDRWDLDENDEPLDLPSTLFLPQPTFIRTLKEAPHLGLHLRHLQIELMFSSYTGQDDAEIEQSLRDVFDACPNLSSLHLDNIGHRVGAVDHVASVLASLPRPPALKEFEAQYDEDGLIPLFDQLPTLRTLSLQGMDSTELPFHRHSRAFPFSLTHLHYWDGVCPRFLCAFISNSFTTLSALEVSVEALVGPEVRRAFPDFVALHDLLVWTYSENVEMYSEAASAVALLPALQELTLYGDTDSSTVHPISTALLPHLPYSLRTLNLSKIYTHASTIMLLFNHPDITPPPNLEVIYFPFVAKRELSGPDSGEKLWWTTAQSCCSNAGVQVVV